MGKPCHSHVTMVFALLAAALLALEGGCASGTIKAELVYFPPPPASPHVVHLKSFNDLGDLVPRRGSWLDFLVRGASPGANLGVPEGLAYHEGRLYVCDTMANVVHVWDLATGRAGRLGDSGETRLSKPVDVAIDNAGRVYVADTGRLEVVTFDVAGQPDRRVKPKDREAFRPVAVTTLGNKLFVADIVAHQVDVFSTDDGEFLGAVGTIGKETGKFYFPMGVTTDSNGSLFVADTMNSRVQVFDSAGSFTGSMGQPGNRYGDMGKPKRVAVGPDGTIFIADVEFGYVHLFNRAGQLLMLMGGPEANPGGTPMPSGVAVAATLPAHLRNLVPPSFEADYYVFVANTVGDKRISLYAVGTAR